MVVGNQYYGCQVTKSQWDKKKFKMYSLKSNRKVNVGKACAEGDEELRRGLMLIAHSSKESGTLRARCPQLSFQPVKDKGLRDFLVLKRNKSKGFSPRW